MLLEEIKALSDEDLIVTLKKHGVSVGPLTATTRPLFQRKLFRALNPEENAETQESCTKNSEPTKVAESTKPVVPPSFDAIRDNAVPASYYSVMLPEGATTNENITTVFMDRKAAMQLMKQYPGSRFKIFNNEQDALNHAKQSTVSAPTSKPEAGEAKETKSKPAAESSPFRGPKPPELSKFRREIESGNVKAVEDTVWVNPRFLISSGDTPAILQENFRYNALHVCALKNQPAAAELVLSVLQNERFFQLMYPDDSEATRQQRISFLTDLYLNTPDKGLNETPLHFACKFGHAEMVAILAAKSQLERCPRNKYGETPLEMNCKRMRTVTAGQKELIVGYLEEQCFVPLLRAVDNSVPARVEQPLSPQALDAALSVDEVNESVGQAGTGAAPVHSPHLSPLMVKAVAGPMSPSQAQRFRRSWVTPPSPCVAERRRLAEVRRGDPSKGLERIGRSLAHELGVSWREFWDFLGCFVDLSTPEGLLLFEAHLKQQYNALCKELKLKAEVDSIENLFWGLKLELQGSKARDQGVNKEKTSAETISKPFGAGSEPVRNLAAIFGGFQTPVKASNNNPFDISSNSNIQTPPIADNPFMLTNKSTNKATVRNHMAALKSTSEQREDVDSFGLDFSKLSLLDNSCDTTKTILDLSESLDIPSIEKQSKDENNGDSSSVKAVEMEHDFNSREAGDCVSKSTHTGIISETSQERTRLSSEEDVQGSKFIEPARPSTLGLERQESEGAETYHSARDGSATPSDDESEDSDAFRDCFESPEALRAGAPLNIVQPDRLFINGKEPSKTDIDVMRAMGDTPVSPLRFPHVFQWRNSVLATSEQNRNRWTAHSTPTATCTKWTNHGTPRGTPRFMQTPQRMTSPASFRKRTLLDDEDEPISFQVQSPSDSDSSLSSGDESLISIRHNLISDFFPLKDN